MYFDAENNFYVLTKNFSKKCDILFGYFVLIVKGLLVSYWHRAYTNVMGNRNNSLGEYSLKGGGGVGGKMRDEGERWKLFDGTYENLGDGKYCCDLVYDQMKFTTSI